MATKKRNSPSKSPSRKIKKRTDVIPREDLERLIYGRGGARRFTQDSPILPDVWFEFGRDPSGKQDLLLNPHYDSSPEEVAQVLEARLEAERKSGVADAFPCEEKSDPGIAYNQSTVVVRLCFHELVRVVLPLTPWWHKYVWRGDGKDLRSFPKDKKLRDSLMRALRMSGEDEDESADDDVVLPGPSKEGEGRRVDPQLIWMMRVIGAIAAAGMRKTSRGLPSDAAKVDACARLVKNLDIVNPREEHQSIVWTVTRNRPAAAAVWRSTMAIKADASRRLFQISCKHLAWAVIDSGIDATHPGFRGRDSDGKRYDKPFKQDGTGKAVRWKNQTRIVATYDFSVIRYLLASNVDAPGALPPSQQKRLNKAKRRLAAHPEEAKELRQGLKSGRSIDWDRLKPLLEVPHTDDEYVVPRHDHGTHVAGILAADWRKEDNDPKMGDNAIGGVCPDLRLYDLRVLDENGAGDEFSVIAALQFIRHLNAHKDVMVVHGANMSLAIRHDVANFACGSTPVCEEAERLVGAGISVVAAAGNNGYLYFITASGPEEGYRSISITDPGNAQNVITVGATHRELAHTYGVSYFSSRGPTGDGRLKPDLVAPGEKIVSTIPGGDSKRSDGTSMAAPHVSGAAALLMARYQELAGKPSRVKEILCRTATDLGREKYFQGAGMLDILRALQSV